jgi:hypothetical protein
VRQRSWCKLQVEPYPTGQTPTCQADARSQCGMAIDPIACAHPVVVEQLPGPAAVAYEAGPTGFDLYRALTGAGIRCEVAAPSKLQSPRSVVGKRSRSSRTTVLR